MANYLSHLYYRLITSTYFKIKTYFIFIQSSFTVNEVGTCIPNLLDSNLIKLQYI